MISVIFTMTKNVKSPHTGHTDITWNNNNNNNDKVIIMMIKIQLKV